VDLHHLLGRLGQVIAPEVIDDPVAGNGPAGVQEQEREQRPLLSRREPNRRVAVENIKRAEKPKVHSEARLTLPPSAAAIDPRRRARRRVSFPELALLPRTPGGGCYRGFTARFTGGKPHRCLLRQIRQPAGHDKEDIDEYHGGRNPQRRRHRAGCLARSTRFE